MRATAKLLIIATICTLSINPTSLAISGNEHLISIKDHPDYKLRIQPALAEFTRENGKRGYNHFFVENVDSHKYTGNQKCPQIFWQEGNQLILFEPYSRGLEFDDLILSRRQLSMTRDVYPKTFHGTNSSTYMLTFDEAQSIKKSCLNGTKFVIRK